MSRGPDAATLLRRALERSADAAGLMITVGEITSVDWASATFAGARHTFDLTLAGDGADAWLARAAEADLPLRGHLVADLLVAELASAGQEIVARIEALTVEER